MYMCIYTNICTYVYRDSDSTNVLISIVYYYETKFLERVA